MDLTNIFIIKKLCREFSIRPSKKLGQNFLISKKPLEKMINAAELSKDDTVIEIGPGFGVLTQELAPRVGQLVVVEKDKRLGEFLEKEIEKLRNKEIKGKIKIINNDILKINLSKYLKAISYKLISNLPYQITSPVLWKFLYEERCKPSMMVLMVQKEVGQRIVAKPRRCANDRGKPGQMSVLSVLCQFYADCEMVSIVGRENFWPQPEVDSAIVKLKIQDTRYLPRLTRVKAGKIQKIINNQFPNYNNFDEKEFFKVVKIGFSAKRKMLKNNLSKGLKISANKVVKALKTIGLSEKIRAQELGVEEWIELFKITKIQDTRYKKAPNFKFQ